MASERRGGEKVLGPGPQWATQPVRQGHPEAHLRAVDQRRRDVAVQDLSQHPLGRPVAHLRGRREPPRRLEDTAVEERCPRLEGDGHRRPVHLGQHVVGQVRHEVCLQELCGDVALAVPGRQPRVIRRARARSSTYPGYQLGRTFPVCGQRPVGLLDCRGLEHPTQLGHLGRGQADLPAFRQEPGRGVHHSGRHEACGAADGAAKARRQRGRPPPDAIQPGVPVVAREKLVAAVTGQGDRHRAPSDRGDEMGRELRAVGERLVPDLRQPGDEFEHLA